MITRQTIESELSERLGTDQSHTWQILVAVGDVVAQTVSPGQIDDVHGQLPDGLRGIFSGSKTEEGAYA
jgi:uncharacterized protein (DUF2267 family)